MIYVRLEPRKMSDARDISKRNQFRPRDWHWSEIGAQLCHQHQSILYGNCLGLFSAAVAVGLEISFSLGTNRWLPSMALSLSLYIYIHKTTICCCCATIPSWALSVIPSSIDRSSIHYYGAHSCSLLSLLGGRFVFAKLPRSRTRSQIRRGEEERKKEKRRS